MRFFGLSSAAFFLLVVVCFFLPFAEIRCSGEKVGSVRGTDLVLGAQYHEPLPFSGGRSRKVEPQPFAILALAAAIAGIAVSLFNSRPAKMLSMLIGIAGGLLMLLLKSDLRGEVASQTTAPLEMRFLTGYWGAVVLFFLSAALNGMALNYREIEPDDPKQLEP